MRRFIALLILSFAITTPLQAQVAPPPCPYEKPHMRAVWERMKAEKHDALLNWRYNTTWERYWDEGRWEMIVGTIDNDDALLVKAFEETKRDYAGFTNIVVRHRLGDHATRYACIYKALTTEQREEYRSWMIRIVQRVLLNHRLGDSDEDMETYGAVAVVDYVLGTKFLEGNFSDPSFAAPGNTNAVGALSDRRCIFEANTAPKAPSMRSANCYYLRVMAKGGTHSESSEYNQGTLWLYIHSAYIVGLQNFPELLEFIPDYVRDVLHDFTPDLNDKWQWGDDENPGGMSFGYRFAETITLLQEVTDQMGRPDLAEMLRQYELDVLNANFGNLTTDPYGQIVKAANGVPFIKANFARYAYFHNPYRATRDWKAYAGTSFVAEGQGHFKWNSDWNPKGKSGHILFTGFDKGVVDHKETHVFGQLKLRKAGMWLLDSPVGYGADPLFQNAVHTATRRYASLESTKIIAAEERKGEVVYATGTSSGMPYYWHGAWTPGGWSNWHHETTRHVFDLLGGPESITIVFDRVHLEDVRTKPFYAGASTHLKRYVEAFPFGSRWTWHMPVQPTESSGTFSWDGKRVQRVYSSVAMTSRILDERLEPTLKTEAVMTDSYFPNYINDSEKMWAVWEDPATWQDFIITSHCITDSAAVTCERFTAPDVEGVTVRRPNREPETVIVSAKPGPKMVTAMPNNIMSFDSTKADQVVAARKLTAAPIVTTKAYVADMGAKLVVLNAGQVPPPPPPPCTYAVSPTSASLTATVGSTTVKVTSSATTCTPPAVKSNTSWLSVTMLQGNALIVAAANTGSTQRVGTVTIGTIEVTITQAAAAPLPPPPCKPEIETFTLGASSSATTVSKFINDKEAQGYTFVEWASGKAIFRKPCLTAGSAPRAVADAPLGAADPSIMAEDGRRRDLELSREIKRGIEEEQKRVPRP